MKYEYDGYHYDLNHVHWYARWLFTDRIAYLDWIITQREAEVKAEDLIANATNFTHCKRN